MKKTFLIALLVLISMTSFAQNDDSKSEKESIPFAVIDNVPVYPGCEKEQGNDALKQCMSNKIVEHVIQNFNTSLANNLGLDGVQQIYAQFKINKKGVTSIINVRAPHKKLKIETIRVLNMLPQMIAGKHNGENVSVLYALPIKFNVENDKPETKKEKRKRLKAEKRAKNQN